MVFFLNFYFYFLFLNNWREEASSIKDSQHISTELVIVKETYPTSSSQHKYVIKEKEKKIQKLIK